MLKKLVPAVDGHNMWPYVIGQVQVSPRTEIMLDSQCYNPGSCVNGSAGKKSPCDPDYLCIGAIISGDFKLVLGTQKYGFWMGPVYPNASTDHSKERPFDCKAGCLFDIQKQVYQLCSPFVSCDCLVSLVLLTQWDTTSRWLGTQVCR